MIYLYCLRRSDGARDVVRALRNLGEESAQGNSPPFNAYVVNWGNRTPPCFRALNSQIVKTKLKELQLLRHANVPCPNTTGNSKPGYIARSLHHTNARDLRRPNTIRGQRYFTEFIPTIREFRLHVFQGKIIRAALKIPNSPEPHPWIRSHFAGWAFAYGERCQRVLTNKIRLAAKQAVAALGYDFGAVDIGVKEDGSPIVFEVNSAPGFTQATSQKYAEHISRWARRQRRET